MSKAKTTVDLDAFLNEALGQGTVIRLYNRDWKLKAEIPALLMLRLRSELSSDEAELTFEQELDLLRALMDPPSQVDELLAAGLGQSAFALLIQVALATYSGADPAAVIETMRAEQAARNALANGTPTVNPGKAPAGTRSSRTGRGSKRTSASTTA